jgi:hypothetical protein
MKTLAPIFLALFIAAIPSLAQEPVTSDDSSSLRTYTPAQFAKEVSANPKDGALIRIKFNGRDSALSSTRDGMKRATLVDREPGPDLTVLVPTAGLEWLQHVEIFTSKQYEMLAVKSYLAYARVKVDASGKTSVVLVGTEIKHDLDGDTIVWN